MITGLWTRLSGHSIAAGVVFVLLLVEAVITLITEPLHAGDAPIFLAMLTFGVLGALILWRRPGNAVGWIFSAMGVSGMLQGAAPQDGVGELLGGLGWFSFFLLTIAILPMLFPTGRALSHRWRWLVVATLAAFAIFAFLWMFQESMCIEGQEGICAERTDNPIGIAGIEDPETSLLGRILLTVFTMAGVAGLISLMIRYRRSRGIERQQLKWLLFSFAALLSFIVIVEITLAVSFNVRLPEPVYGVLSGIVWLGVPTAAGLAVFRYGLYDIDRIISRTLAYGLVAVTLTAAYVAVVIGVGAIVTTVSTDVVTLDLPVLATALVALAFQPVRQKALRVANRMVFGRRRTPYEALAGVAGGSLDELLPQIARLATESTAARRAIVWMAHGTELRAAATFPDDGSLPDPVPLDNVRPPKIPGGNHTVSLSHHDDLLGAISVMVGPGETLPADDRRLLDDLAAHSAVTLRGVLDATPLPAGIVTFLMTDIEGSTRLWEQDPESMAAALRDHDSIIRQVVTHGNGVLVKWRGEGDSSFSVFTSAPEGVAAAAALQDAIRRHPWQTPWALSIRAALHTGEAELRERDYYGQTVNRCARLRSLAQGGQTLVTAATRELAREGLPDELTFEDLGEHRLKDVSEPEHVYEVVARPLAVSEALGQSEAD